jgi:hypothetical protein
MAPNGRAGARRTQKRDVILAAAERLLTWFRAWCSTTSRRSRTCSPRSCGAPPTASSPTSATPARSPHLLRAVWAYANDQRGSALLLEFLALANHRPQLRAVLGDGGERVRQALLASVTARWEAENRNRSGVPAAAALLLLDPADGHARRITGHPDRPRRNTGARATFPRPTSNPSTTPDTGQPNHRSNGLYARIVLACTNDQIQGCSPP